MLQTPKRSLLAAYKAPGCFATGGICSLRRNVGMLVSKIANV